METINMPTMTLLSHKELTNAIETQENLSNDVIACLAQYKLIYWSVEYTRKELSNAYICRNGIEFRIRYNSKFIKQVNELLAINPQAQIRVSFRMPLPAYKTFPFVYLALTNEARKGLNHD